MPKHMAGQNTLFPHKILKCLEKDYPGEMQVFKMRTFFNYARFKGWDTPEAKEVKPKLHTIRSDKNGRWTEGRDIHFVINNRSKNRYQFAPLIPCASTEDIFFSKPRCGRIEVSIGDKYLYHSDLTKLAINDGFRCLEDFEAYFEPQIEYNGMSRTLIHWTDFKY